MTEQHTLLWEPGSGGAPLPSLVDLSGVIQEEQPLVSLYRPYGPPSVSCSMPCLPIQTSGFAYKRRWMWGQGTLSNFTLQCDPPDYQLVIEHHPTSVLGNHFRVMVAERRFSLFREDGR
jgi:hypothetical protein